MNIETIGMDPRIAAVHYKEYRKKVREHKKKREEAIAQRILEAGRELRAARTEKSHLEKEDQITMASYREMAKGHRIVNVAEAFQHAGLEKKNHLPALAIAQADWRFVFLHRDNQRMWFAREPSLYFSWASGDPKPKSAALGFQQTLWPDLLWNWQTRKDRGIAALDRRRALVPQIPPHLRPEGDLSKFHILWEADWEAAPGDPLLLRHIGGNMYSVLAQWDLTPVERAVLEGRLT